MTLGELRFRANGIHILQDMTTSHACLAEKVQEVRTYDKRTFTRKMIKSSKCIFPS